MRMAVCMTLFRACPKDFTELRSLVVTRSESAESIPSLSGFGKAMHHPGTAASLTSLSGTSAGSESGTCDALVRAAAGGVWS